MSLLDLGMQLRHALVIKGHFSANKHIEHDAETPNIDLRPSVLLCLQQLRCSEVQATAKRFQLVPWREEIAQSKVDDLDVASFADQNILDL